MKNLKARRLAFFYTRRAEQQLLGIQYLFSTSGGFKDILGNTPKKNVIPTNKNSSIFCYIAKNIFQLKKVVSMAGGGFHRELLDENTDFDEKRDDME